METLYVFQSIKSDLKYLAISLSSSVCNFSSYCHTQLRVLEKLVYSQLVFFLEKHSILHQFQFGFRKGHSTEHAILKTVEYLKNALDQNMLTCDIFLDFSKAFDTRLIILFYFKYV